MGFATYEYLQCKYGLECFIFWRVIDGSTCVEHVPGGWQAMQGNNGAKRITGKKCTLAIMIQLYLYL